MLLYPATTGTSAVADTGRYERHGHQCAVAFLSIDNSPADLADLLCPPGEKRREPAPEVTVDPKESLRGDR
jgi:hypothetical protein